MSTYLSSRRLGEPESPRVGQRMLDIEVVGIVEDSDNVRCTIRGLSTIGAICRERAVGHCYFSHDCRVEIIEPSKSCGIELNIGMFCM